MSLLWRRRRDLHQDQIRAIEGLPVNGRFMIAGPPGSGKTSILLHRGQWLRLPPNNLANCALLTFSRTLREFIAISGDDRFPAGLILTVRTFVDQIFRSYGAPVPLFADGTPLSEQNRQRAIEAMRLISEGGDRIHYDALLIDEVQDLSGEEVSLFASLCSRMMIVGDSRQRLYSVNGGMEAAIRMGCEVTTLQHHFRISPQICAVADRILRQDGYILSEYCHYRGPNPTEPNLISGSDRIAQITSLKASLDIQVDTYNDPADLIGIVVASREDCDFVAAELEEQDRLSGRIKIFHSGVPNRSFGPDGKICIVTIQASKGLEFRALHWLFADENARYLTREAAYTVVTRAKTSLSVYHNGRLPGILAGAFPPAPRGLFDDD